MEIELEFLESQDRAPDPQSDSLKRQDLPPFSGFNSNLRMNDPIYEDVPDRLRAMSVQQLVFEER